MSEAKWGEYQFFTKREFDCKETGENNMQDEFMQTLSVIRRAYGKPMQITSGYRSPSHSKEASKATPGEHTMGLAADVYAVSSGDRFRLLKVLFDLHIPRIGIAKNFIHIGTSKDLPQGVVWVY